MPGSTGWASNDRWDGENFNDLDGDRLWDPGEPFQDGSNGGPQDGHYNSEFYDPIWTGYQAFADLGAQITLGPSAGSHSWYAVNLPGSSSSSDYRFNLGHCNPSEVSVGGDLTTQSAIVIGPTAQELRNIINQDPTATWSPECNCAVGPYFDQSPRYLILVAHDPRLSLSPGDHRLRVTKLIGFFLESQTSDGTITGRLAHIQRAGGQPCSNGGDFIRDCAVPVLPASWGAVKAHYR